jgi:predicted transcriptional regulator
VNDFAFAGGMDVIKRLPDAEFEVMRVIWRSEHPITTSQIMKMLEPKNNWKPQTVMTMLVRLIEKKFLSSERVGKERNYTPIIGEHEYMRAETGDFMARYRGNSVGSLVKTMYEGKNLSPSDIQELKQWLKDKGE